MATYTRRITSVQAVQHFGGNMPVSSQLKGDQIANNGDFLVVDPNAVASLRKQEKDQKVDENSLGNKGTVYVVGRAEFIKEFDATDNTPGLKPDTGFNVPDQLDVNAAPGASQAISSALAKSSGDGTTAGDWTAAGDGTTYPQPVLSQSTVYPRPLTENPVAVDGATAPLVPAHGEVLTPAPEADLRNPSIPEVITKDTSKDSTHATN